MENEKRECYEQGRADIEKRGDYSCIQGWQGIEKCSEHQGIVMRVEDQKKAVVTLSDEQLDRLAQSLLPAMQEFFGSERGKKIWEEHLERIRQSNCNAALDCGTLKNQGKI